MFPVSHHSVVSFIFPHQHPFPCSNRVLWLQRQSPQGRHETQTDQRRNQCREGGGQLQRASHSAKDAAIRSDASSVPGDAAVDGGEF